MPQPLTDTVPLAAAGHAGAVPLALVGVALLLAALVVRRIIKLALVIVVVGLAAVALAAWRGGLLTG